MKAEIVATGTELLLGQIVDTHTAFLADQLALLGIDLYYTSTVGDNHDRMLWLLKQAWDRSDLIITTGGLGPTRGDITRDVIADLAGEKQYIDDDLKRTIEGFFSRRGLEMPRNNLKQAMLLPSARPILNPNGTAPGWWLEKDGRTVIALPGPPRELQPMWQTSVAPKLQARSGAVIVSRILKTNSLSEARVDELLAEFTGCANPTLAMYAKMDGIQLRITAKAASLEVARNLIDKREAEIRAVLDTYIWGVDGESLESLVARLLREKSLSLAVAESFTGGFLTQALASASECRPFFKGGSVNCDRDGQGDEAARAMATEARRYFGSDIGIGISGRTDAAGSLPTTWVFIAIDLGRGKEPVVNTYSGGYLQVKARAAYFALFDMRKALLSL